MRRSDGAVQTRAAGTSASRTARHAAVTGAAVLYLGIVLFGPLLALFVETARHSATHLVHALTAPAALAALRMSLILMVIAVVVNTVVGILCAIALVRGRFLGRSALSVLCDLPLTLSPVMVGLAFLLLMGRDGLMTPALSAVGIKVVFSFPGLVIATLFVTLPFAVREVAYVLEEVGTSEEEASATLGATAWKTFWRVTLPNIRLALAYGLLMTAARSLGEFGALLVLGGSITEKTQTATTFINDAMEERELSGAYAMAVVLALVSVVLLLAIEWAKDRRHRGEQRNGES